ncbi:MAG: hypothetical protein PHU08_03360, partial [Dehalococcoidales bacterium]|nr:hypothetical protein [Dehalococcoidales bacterium]
MARSIFWLAVLLLAATFSAPAALAFPQMPHQFYGSVTINSQPAPPGVPVSVRINGLDYAETTTDDQGRYGYSPAFFIIPADNPETVEREGGTSGDRLEFYAAGWLAGNAIFGFGQVTRLDMAVSLNPPSVVTDAATWITSNAVTLNGSLNSLGTASKVSVCFEYGTTSAYGNVTQNETMAFPDVFGARI